MASTLVLRINFSATSPLLRQYSTVIRKHYIRIPIEHSTNQQCQHSSRLQVF